MRFVDINGSVFKERRSVSRGSAVFDEDVKDPVKLAEILRNALGRISELEARTVPEAAEFEVSVSTAGAKVNIRHEFNTPVRFFVTSWKGGSAGPSLVKNTTDSDNKVLVLQSYVAGTAIIRIEQAKAGN